MDYYNQGAYGFYLWNSDDVLASVPEVYRSCKCSNVCGHVRNIENVADSEA